MSEYAAMGILLCLLILLSAVVALCKNVRGAVLAYALQVLVLCGVLFLLADSASAEGLLAKLGTTVVLKAVLIPVVILFALEKAEAAEAEAAPAVGPAVFLLLTALEITVCFCFVSAVAPSGSDAALPVLSVAFGLFFMGLSVVVVYRDVFRQIFGYLLMEAGSHLALAVLAPAMPEVAEISITLASVLVVSVMCFFAVCIRRAVRTLDTDQLRELKG